MNKLIESVASPFCLLAFGLALLSAYGLFVTGAQSFEMGLGLFALWLAVNSLLLIGRDAPVK